MTLSREKESVDRVGDQLLPWLLERLPAAAVDVRVADLRAPAAGYSGGTVLFTLCYRLDGREVERRLVLRHDPEDPLFLGVDLGLQWRMLEALDATPVPVPRLLWHEPGAETLGCPFFVMAHVDGLIPSDRPSHHAEGWITEVPRSRRRGIVDRSLAMLARLHTLDWHDGFEFLAEVAVPGLDGYLSWTEDWYEWVRDGRGHPLIEDALTELRRCQPVDPPVAVLWGDPRLGNIVFDAQTKGVSALLDWEMATLGPPEVDLGWWLMMDRFWSEGAGVPRLDGLPGPDETVRMYERHLGRPVEDLGYYRILALVRFAIISVRQTDRRVARGLLPPGTDTNRETPIRRMLEEALKQHRIHR